MAKNSVSDYDTDPNNNTDVGGHNIGEGCPPSGMNNAVRTMMAHAKTEKVLKDGITHGFRNKIINGDLTGTIPGFPINQREHATPLTPGIGNYGYDRWKGHASGLEQICQDLEAGEYTLTWSGGGTGSLAGGTPAVSPIKATIGAGNISVVVPTTAGRVSLVAGDATSEVDPFSPRHKTQEMVLCKSYTQLLAPTVGDQVDLGLSLYYDANLLRFKAPLEAEMQDVPTVSFLGTANVDYAVYANATQQSGFTFGAANFSTKSVIITADKNSHGVPNLPSTTLLIVAGNKGPLLIAEL